MSFLVSVSKVKLCRSESIAQVGFPALSLVRAAVSYEEK